ncbi:MAG: hypothetical protein J6L90_04075 [Clostridia bacterium]|nr:hypothetical protein [Clostridia bacterium]
MKRNLKLFLTLLFCCAVSLCAVFLVTTEAVAADVSTVKLSTVFDDGMVLQRNMPINVFGECDKVGAEVKVTLGETSVTATVSADKKFKATLPAMEAATGLTLTVEQLSVATPVVHTFKEVSVGEVIVVSGQSNAAYQLYMMEDAEEYIANADNFSNIHLYCTPRTYDFFEAKGGVGKWYKVNSSLLKKNSEVQGDVSAIGYVLATRIANELGDSMPIGLIDAAYAGSGIFPFLEFNNFKTKFSSGNEAHIKRYEDYVNFYNANGRYPTSTSEVSGYQEKPYGTTPGICYNTLIAPIFGYTAKFALWYQGEANIENLKTNYDTYFNELKAQYKSAFSNPNLKFFAVQLAPYQYNAGPFRSLQYKMSEADDTYLISAAREGSGMTGYDLSQGYVHSSRKSPIGHRVADSVLKNIYEKDTERVVEAPKVKKIERNGSKVIITFDTDVSYAYGNSALGFELASTNLSYKSATGTIVGNKVTLTASGVTTPAYVRYAFGRMDFVLNDGSVVTYINDAKDTIDKDQATVHDASGKTYTFTKNCGLVIETRFPGNITNISGHPMPTFDLPVGYTK